MPVACRFTLNGQVMSVLSCIGIGDFQAFSGHGKGRNNPVAAAMPDLGPLPRGRYYIVDRRSGGRLGALRDFMLDTFYGTDRTRWFALYRNDAVIDDFTFEQGVRRGSFRLHPIGPLGLSEGCITLLNYRDFATLHDHLQSSPTLVVPGTELRAYGTVDVQ